MRRLLILRPEPGAARTRDGAEAAGWQATMAPLFTVGPRAWDAPDPAAHDAVMATSANALRHGGAGLARFRHLPLFAVGQATAATARAAGFARVTAGEGDAADLMRVMAAHGVACPLHLAGREHRGGDAPFPVTRRIVYAADAVAALPAAAQAALAEGAVALLHSPRAASLLHALLSRDGPDPAAVAVAAISPAAAQPWPLAAIAERPTDEALLAAAARLCDKG